jgi:hypothetical protein
MAAGMAIGAPLRAQAAQQSVEAIKEEEPGRHVCGLIVLPYLFEGAVAGGLIGGVAGGLTAAALCWRWKSDDPRPG